jgi:L-methionine (R)-S-oxide reductase
VDPERAAPATQRDICLAQLVLRRLEVSTMAESFSPDDLPADKAARYAEVASQLAAILDGEPNPTARQATAVSLLVQAFAPRFFWTGFYLVDPARGDELVVGPYAGTLGCLRIRFGKGVCGTAAASRETQLVDDVHAFPGHIACDSRSASEIVVPLVTKGGTLLGVLDVDATTPAAFDAVDKTGLEAICAIVAG